MSRLLLRCGLLVAVAAVLALPAVTRSCPFCGGVMLTLSDEMKTSDVVLIAQIAPREERPLPTDPLQAALEVVKTKFQVVQVLKGKELLGDAEQIEVLYFGEEPEGTNFLVQGTKIPDLAFNTPVPLSERALEYVGKLPGLPEKGPERLAFFQDYLEDAEDLLARDAYDEFAKAPYAEIHELGERLYHDKLVAWIKNPDTTTSRRRQYLALLGVCGRDDKRPEDIAMLEEAITAEGDAPKPALDATIACYLTFKGEEGLPLIEDQFLKNKDCTYSDTYSAIMALRFHGQEEEIIPKERLLAALRHLLDRPELADLIIPDLARWQDWSAMERLVTLFKEADEKSSWVRVPVVQYLRVCPLPEAAKHLEELAQIDPEAVKRASFFVPLGAGAAPKPVPPPADGEPMPVADDPAADPADPAAATTGEDPDADGPADTADTGDGDTPEGPAEQPLVTQANGDSVEAAESDDAPADAATLDPAAAPQPEPAPAAAAATPSAEAQVASPSQPATTAAGQPAAPAGHNTDRPEPTLASRLVVLVPLGLGAGLFVLLLVILRGGRRSLAKVNP